MTEELTVDTAMSQRFELVEQIAIISGRHKNELAPLLEVLNMAEQYIKSEMLAGNMQQLKTASGHMAYFTTKTSCTVEDFDATLAEIKEKGLWHLLNKAVNKTAVAEYIEANHTPPSGVRFDSFRDLSWRRGKVA